MRKLSEKPINTNSNLKGRHRSAVRLSAGKIYFTLKRRLFWIFGGVKFAKKYNYVLSFEHYSHQTPLLRNLKDVDMYLQHNKIVNLKIAVPKINKVILYPGETFSYWRLIGKPTKRKGYVNGMVLQNGKFKEGIGGGLCQLSNLIYWMAVHTPLTVTERHRHGYDVFPDSDRTQPFGSGATCYYNYGDLMIKNNTSHSFQILVYVTETHLTGAIISDTQPEYTYEVYEKEHIMRSEYWGGYTRHNILFRKKINSNGVVEDDEFVVENHAVMMYSPFLTNNKQ